MKKGVSPIIASVVLIAITITLASIIFLSSKGFFNQLTPPTACNSVRFEAGIYNDISTSNYILEVNNNGNENIKGFNLIIIDESNGEIDIERIGLQVKIGDSISEYLTLQIKGPLLSPALESQEDGGEPVTNPQFSPKKLILVPIINNAKGIPAPCDESHGVKISN